MKKRIVIPERLLAARRLTGLSVAKFINLAGMDMDRQALARYEKGTVNMKPKFLPPLARVLDVPESFFLGQGPEMDKTKFRKSTAGSGVEESDLRVVEAELALLNQRFGHYERLAGRHVDVGHLKCYNKTPEGAAAKLRRMWNLGTEPITSVTGLLEKKGIRMFFCPMPDKLPAVSTYCDREYPVIAINSKKGLLTTCRTRLAALHELGHLVLTIPYGEDPEPLCDRFAVSMLLPREALAAELGERCGHMSEADAAYVHNIYGIPVSVLVNHAYGSGIIPQEERDRWLDIIGSEADETRWGDYPVDERPTLETRLKARLRGRRNEEE